jgi:protein-disulfide isomerase
MKRGVLRRFILAAAMALGFAAGASGAQAYPDDMALGNLKAPVTVIEYASVGCPHCATWAINVFPGFKAKYIDTGRVRFVFREMLTGQPTLAAAGFLTARCAGPARYFDIVDQIFRAQNEMVQAGDAYGPLLRIAKGAGLTSDQFDSCMKDHAALSALEARSDRNGQENGISGTPTFVIGDRKLEGDQSLESLGAAVASAEHR